MCVLGMSRNEFLYDIDIALVIEMTWAHWERESGKHAPWSVGLLKRVTNILRAENGEDTKNSIKP
jgi:hypothetical protein